MKKRAFTLIELLAVIVILAVIAIISTPIVFNVIENAKEKANLNSAYGLLDAGKLYYSESLLNETKAQKVKYLLNVWDDVAVSGNKPMTGELYVNQKGLIALSTVIDETCYQKSFTGELTEYSKEECGLGIVGPDSNAPTVSFVILEEPFNESNWANVDFYVKVLIEDTESGADSYRWCHTLNGTCDPISVHKGNQGTVLINTESSQNQICVIGKDRNGNESNLTCSDIYKLDKTNPSLSGIGDLTVEKNENVDLFNGVEAFDAMSGINGTFHYSPASVDTSKSGTTEITYQVSDYAGNTQRYIRKIMVEADALTVTFAEEPEKINEQGWAREDFLVTFTANDARGFGIKEFRWCATTSASCDPSGNTPQAGAIGATTINVESASNRICVIATDNNGKNSANICSDGYRLDKTAPTAGSFTINGTTGTNGWFIGAVSLSANDGSDALSGHASTNSDQTVIHTDGANQIVTMTTSDLAGNTATREARINVDMSIPTIQIDPITVTIDLGDNYNLLEGVSVTDNGPSGISENWIQLGNKKIENAQALLAGPNVVTYYAKDQAGNIGTSDRTIIANTTDASYFTFDSATKTITGYSSAGPKKIIIPNQIGGVNVEKIGNKAFYQMAIVSVIIPASVRSIDESAFSNNKLTNVMIPSSVTSIGNQAFFINTITSVTISSGVRSIGDSAFQNNQLTSLDLPSSVTSIGMWAFKDNRLTNVTIPNSVTNIGGGAFNDNQLSDMQAFIYQRYPNGTENKTTVISYGGKKRANIIIPSTVTIIGDLSFFDNYLTSVTIPNNVTRIERGAFWNNSLTSVVIPNKVTYIGLNAFFTNQLTSVTIPSSVTEIHSGAFLENQLTSVRIVGKSSSSQFSIYNSGWGWKSGYSDKNIIWNAS